MLNSTLSEHREDAFRLGAYVRVMLVAWLLALLALLVPGEPAMAQSPTPFSCSPDFFQVVNNVSGQPFQGNFNRLYELDPQTGNYSLIQTNDIGSYNAIAYNVEDNLIYGILSSNRNLMRIGANGVAQNLGPVTGLPNGSIFVGAFDLNGNLYVRQGADMYRIDVSASPPVATKITLKTPTGSTASVPNIADWGFIDVSDGANPTRFLLAGVLNGGDQLVFFDLTGPTASTATAVTVSLSGDIRNESGAFGANYPVATTGNELFVSSNNTGNIFRLILNLNTNNVANSSAVGAFTAIGTPTGSNDGASCATAASPFPDTVANDDSGTTSVATPVTMNLVVNDTSVPGNNVVAASLTIQQNPANGTVNNLGDGRVTYTPNPGFAGTDSYTYQVCNNANPAVCDDATVTVTVNPAGNLPLAKNDPADTDEEIPVIIPVLFNDSDPDGDPLTVTQVTNPANGTVVINAGSTVTYTPNPGFCDAQDSFNYTIVDGNGGTATATVTVDVACVSAPPSETSTPVQSGGEGGLESGPLDTDPSTFIGGIGADEGMVAAALQEVQIAHKARLLEQMSLKVDDLMPTVGPAGTTPQEAVPVDVLAVTTAPDALAVDFVDGAGQVRAVALGINSVDGPYEHDYGVCNRFKTYEFDTIEPLNLAVTAGASSGNYWFWHTISTKGQEIREDAMIFHIFVDEQNQRFHIDSRWIMNDYPDQFDYDFDYVFNMQVWSGDIATTTDLLNGILEKMTTLDDGAWELVFHNTDEPTHRAVFIESSDYHADNITVQLRNVTDSEQPVLIQGKWRSQVDRSTNTPFSFELALPAGTTSLSLPFPGLLDVTLVVESGNAQDKIYAGGGLWFDFSNSDSAETTMDLPQCRPLEDIDLSDLMLAGCTDLHGTAVGQSDEVGLGRTLNPNGRPVDVSPYRGLRFWAKGDGTPIRVVLETAAVTDSDHYQAIFTPDNEWRQYILPLEAFAQRGFGAAVPFTGRDVKAVIWTNASVPGGALQLSLDQVSFTNHGLVTAATLPSDSADTNARQIAVNTSASGSIRTMNLYYSLNDGESFIALPMDSAGDDIQFVTTLPGQDLGSDVLFYIVAEDQNGYRSQSPIDAPASLFRYRVDDRDGLLIDDFAGESLRNRQDGRAGVFNSPQAGGALQVYRTDRQLVLDYNVDQADQFAGYFTNLDDLNATSFTTLNLLVRGARGGEQMLVGLRDGDGREIKVSLGDVMNGTLTNQWQWVQIPLQSFGPTLNLETLKNVSFTFSADYAPTSGRVAVREMRFTGLATPLIIDRFNDRNDMRNGQGLVYWTTAPNAGLNAVLVAGDASTVNGGSLQLDYAVQAGGYALWRTGLNTLATTADAELVFWTKGGQQAIMPNLYVGDGSNRARLPLADHVTLNGRWQEVRIPLQAVAAQGVDLSRLSSFEVAFEFAIGSGQLWFDNISIEAPGSIQAERRVLHMTDRDQRSLALHNSGGAWSSRSDSEWLLAAGYGAGAANLDVYSVDFGLSAGEYEGNLVFRNAAGSEETVTVYLTVTEDNAPAQRLFLPQVGR